MVNVSNVFAAAFSFFIGLIILYCISPIEMYIIGLFTDLVLRSILTVSLILFIMLMMIYFPILILTSEDTQGLANKLQ